MAVSVFPPCVYVTVTVPAEAACVTVSSPVLELIDTPAVVGIEYVPDPLTVLPYASTAVGVVATVSVAFVLLVGMVTDELV